MTPKAGQSEAIPETRCTVVHVTTSVPANSERRLALMHDRASQSVVWGEEIRRRRVELGLHQDELAALAGVSTRFVHTLEQGKPSLQLDKILAVLGQLGLDLVLEPGTGIIRYGED
jgi:HTH-type transcriptional regulator/antitoxin HipB